MSKQQIIIRVDGNPQIGLGHIYRGIALAEMLKDEFEISFLTKKNTTVSPINDAGFKYKYLPDITTIDEPAWLKQNVDNKSIIICDGYEFKSEYQKQIKQCGFKLVFIDDLSAWHMYADIVINHSPGVKKSDYSRESYTKLALGFDYAILRPAFLKAVEKGRVIKQIHTAFICFGGADIYDLSFRATTLFLQLNEIKRINILLGASYIHKKIFDLKKVGKEIVFYKNLSDQQIVKVILNSDLGIVPSSSILYEVCAVNLPVASGYYVENQKSIYHGALTHKCIYPLGDIKKLDYHKIFSFVSEIKMNFNRQLQYQKQVLNINIKSRILDLFINL